MKTLAVILAGGVGARLWPRSREHKPKQFLSISSEQTLIQQTFARIRSIVPPEDVIVITGVSTLDLARQQLPEIPAENIIAEPFGRNTAAAIGLAMTIAPTRHPDEEVTLAIFPADHVVVNTRDFIYAASLCASMASSMEGLILLGVQPVRPETGFGYIQAEDHNSLVLDTITDTAYTLRRITNFAEKPDVETAIRFVNSGDFLWNTGIMFARVSSLQSAFEEHLPDHAQLFKMLSRHVGKPTYPETLDNVYRQLRSVSVDYGILEKSRHIYVIEGTFDWNDIGSWDSVYQMLQKDSSNNALVGDVIALDAHDNFVSAQNKMIALVGVEDLVVIESEDALVICRRGHSQEVKDVVDFLRRRQIREFL
jgi:mannose-1-phosphate guanylyltransferase